MDIKHGTKLVHVSLSEDEWVAAFKEAYRRNTEARFHRSSGSALGLGVLAAASELVVAGVTGAEWTAVSGRGSEDVRGFEVKYTGGKELVVRDRNPDGRYVVVTGGLSLLTVRGWYDFVKANEVPVRPDWKFPKQDDDPNAVIYPIPFSRLRPIKEIISAE